MSKVNFSRSDLEQVRQAALYMNETLDSHLTIEELAKKMKIPEKKFKAVFKQVYGMGIYSYLRHQRMEVAKKMLLSGVSIDTIVTGIGFVNKSNFSKAFRKAFQDTPSSWRQKQQTIPSNLHKK